MYKLVIQDDEGKTTVVPLIRDEITIGRKEGNTIRLTERNVSRKHARIVRSNGTVAIEDLGSYNGVRVNGTRISQRTPLTVSDRVQIGDYLIELKAEGAEQGVAPHGYDDAKTQPVERIDPSYGQRGGTQPMPAAMALGGLPTPPAGVTPGLPAHASAEALGVSDTDPRLPTVRSPSATVSSHARLVILSSNFAGRELELVKPQMVIGRTDDNDIVINHRSISRNHAKVVREADTGRYTIMDLQSSNGVRVNGEEYGKVELRRGDLVDLGHVRLRFVEAGEDFLFGRDAHAVDLPTGGGKGLWIGLAALLLAGGAVGVVMATRGGGDSEEASPSGGAGAALAVVADAAPVGVVPDEGIDEPAVPEPSGDEKKLHGLRTDIQGAVDSERWPEVNSKCNELLELVPDDADCTRKKEQAKREMAAQLKFGDFTQAVQKKNYPAVAQLFREIDSESMYKEQARGPHDRLRDEYVGNVRSQAAALVRQGKCKDIDRLSGRAAQVWEEAAAAARAELARCNEAVAAAEPRERRDPRRDVKKDDKKDDGATAAASSGKAFPELKDEANAAARAGQYGKALRVAEEALRMQPSDQEVLTTAAIAACNLKQAEKVKKFTVKLSASRASMVRQICLRNNVTID
jgi:ABC transport system ATP-binding/permease protein